MPYLTPLRKEELDTFTVNAETAGDLNYITTRLCQYYIDKYGKKYENYNTVIGMLECCKLEFYRRAVATYEDKKIEENGDVYV